MQCISRIEDASSGTHRILLDMRPKKLTRHIAEKSLGRAHITRNKSGVPFDPEKPTVTSGVRLVTPAGTKRGFGGAGFREVGGLIADVLDSLAAKRHMSVGRLGRHADGVGSTDRPYRKLQDGRSSNVGT